MTPEELVALLDRIASGMTTVDDAIVLAEDLAIEGQCREEMRAWLYENSERHAKEFWEL